MKEAPATKFSILSDPTRLAVIASLMVRSRHVNELCEELAVEQSRMSHHLQILRRHGFVRAKREGQRIRYQIEPRLRGGEGDHRLDLGCCQIAFPPPSEESK